MRTLQEYVAKMESNSLFSVIIWFQQSTKYYWSEFAMSEEASKWATLHTRQVSYKNRFKIGGAVSGCNGAILWVLSWSAEYWVHRNDMHEGYGYRDRFTISISINPSCLAKERCIPVTANLKLRHMRSESSGSCEVYSYTSTGVYLHSILSFTTFWAPSAKCFIPRK
jgi:hypothetical protein